MPTSGRNLKGRKNAFASCSKKKGRVRLVYQGQHNQWVRREARDADRKTAQQAGEMPRRQMIPI